MVKRIIAVIESPSGSSWEQELEVVNGDYKKALADYKKTLGKGYWICNWWFVKEEEEQE